MPEAHSAVAGETPSCGREDHQCLSVNPSPASLRSVPWLGSLSSPGAQCQSEHARAVVQSLRPLPPESPNIISWAKMLRGAPFRREEVARVPCRFRPSTMSNRINHPVVPAIAFLATLSFTWSTCSVPCLGQGRSGGSPPPTVECDDRTAQALTSHLRPPY